jgi:hypothetical protein
MLGSPAIPAARGIDTLMLDVPTCWLQEKICVCRRLSSPFLHDLVRSVALVACASATLCRLASREQVCKGMDTQVGS